MNETVRVMIQLYSGKEEKYVKSRWPRVGNYFDADAAFYSDDMDAAEADAFTNLAIDEKGNPLPFLVEVRVGLGEVVEMFNIIRQSTVWIEVVVFENETDKELYLRQAFKQQVT